MERAVGGRLSTGRDMAARGDARLRRTKTAGFGLRPSSDSAAHVQRRPTDRVVSPWDAEPADDAGMAQIQTPLQVRAGARHSCGMIKRGGVRQTSANSVFASMFRTQVARTVLSAARRPALAARAAPVARAVPARMYHEKVISHYERPRNVRIQTRRDLDRPYLITFAGRLSPKGGQGRWYRPCWRACVSTLHAYARHR